MKILFLFCDMLRPDQLNCVNPKKEKGEIDGWLERLGGTVYTRAYSPAPDTSRSMGAFYSGLYPNRNGCREIEHYPRVYLETENHIFRFFREQQHRIYIFATPVNSRKQFPEHVFDYSYLSYDPLEMMKQVRKDREENSIAFMTIEDYHGSIGLSPTAAIGDRIGQLHLSNTFSQIFDIISPDYWDHIFIFSDHGCKFYNEPRRGLDVLDYDRTGITLFWHRKGDDELAKNDSIVSIMDIYPTIMELLGKDPSGENFDGKSLTLADDFSYLVIENNYFVSNEVGFRNTVWCYVDKDYYFTQQIDFDDPVLDRHYKLTDNRTGKVISSFGDKEKLAFFRSKIEEHSCDYKYGMKVVKQYENTIQPFLAPISHLFNEKGKAIRFTDGQERRLYSKSDIFKTKFLIRSLQIFRMFKILANRKKLKRLIQAMME